MGEVLREKRTSEGVRGEKDREKETERDSSRETDVQTHKVFVADSRKGGNWKVQGKETERDTHTHCNDSDSAEI